ncbi:lachesin isoform X2 [Eurytemora carolleeae]|uniref:lachesin isoform X2 n=1 Tax=Eurytemora carolleeae TaxID=1294199 RepID=UPI000C78B0EC|nr:lachesin isoform X2 [Eurytemora carolleeae]|eukprot:XP_023337137.1 lachesin-like isoform X2 [Eurytemora affinis]
MLAELNLRREVSTNFVQVFIIFILILPFNMSNSSEYLGSGVESGGTRRNKIKDPGSRIPPTFKSGPRVYKEELGTTALLLCKVNNLGDSIIVWKQPDRIISAGMGMIRKDKRMALIGGVDGINLEIKHLNRDDAGNYICEVENSGEPVLQTNTLQVLVPPKITTQSRSNLTVRKESSLMLSCNASGFPEPRITWQRQHQMLPSGEKILNNTFLKFEHVQRSDSGTYICTANNGVGPPVQETISVNVIYSPEIDVDKRWVHGGVGYEAVISCLVYGDPEPQVLWYRNTMLLDRNEKRLMEQYGQRHRLVITDMGLEDFGNYSCSAENELGKSRGFIQLSGEPNMAVVLSSSHGMFSDKFNLTWSVESFAPILGNRIMYRKFMSSEDPNYDTRSRWHTVLPHNDNSFIDNNFRHEFSYLYFALEPNTKYETLIQARNEHGWGKYSEMFLFSTRAADDVPKELPVESIDLGSDNNWSTIGEMGLKSSSSFIQTHSLIQLISYICSSLLILSSVTILI